MGTPFGFPDWQKQSPWDGPLLLSLNADAGLHSNVFGPVYVGRWARIAGNAFIAERPTLWTFTWYADQAATIQLGRRVLTTNPNIAVPAAFVLPNLGPWLKVAYDAGGATDITITHHLYGSNRQQPLDIVPHASDLTDSYSVVVGAGASVDVFLNDYYAGAAELWMTRSAQWRVTLRTQVDQATVAGIIQWDANPGGSTIRESMIVPASACWLEILDQSGAAATAFFALTASYNVAA